MHAYCLVAQFLKYKKNLTSDYFCRNKSQFAEFAAGWLLIRIQNHFTSNQKKYEKNYNTYDCNLKFTITKLGLVDNIKKEKHRLTKFLA